MGPKAAETTHNINTFGPGSTYKGTVQWWCKKFCKGDKSLKGIEHHGQPKEADDQLRGSLKLILLQLQEKFQKNTLLTILWSCSTWTKLERWKSSISGYLMSWLQIKKKHHFELSSSLVCNNSEPFLYRILSWYVTRSGFYMTTGNGKLSGWTYRKLQSVSQSQTCTKIRSWSLFGDLLPSDSAASLIQYSVLNPSETITSEKYAQQINEMQKLNKFRYKVSLHLPYSPGLLTTNYYFFKHLDNFLQGECFHKQQEAKTAFQFIESQSTDF